MRSLEENREIASLGFRMARAWEELPQMTIAAIEGYAIGGGVALAAALDWRVIARDAFVSFPEIALGIPLTWGTLPRTMTTRSSRLAASRAAHAIISRMSCADIALRASGRFSVTVASAPFISIFSVRYMCATLCF